MPRTLRTHIDSPKAVGRRLLKARRQARLSQRQLAFPGCTAAYISRLEVGARTPSLQMINELAKRLDVSGQWLAIGRKPDASQSDEAVVLTNDQREVFRLFGGTTAAERRFLAEVLRALRIANARDNP